MLSDYSGIAPKSDLILIKRLCERFRNRHFLHINSTRAGGGVAEILQRMVPILKNLGIDTRWEVIKGDKRFYDITKRIHNALQGSPEAISEDMWKYHYEVNRTNAEKLNLDADAVLIHDPQPAPLIEFRHDRGHWIWRCHIDLSSPREDVCNRLQEYCKKYTASIFSVARFTRAFGNPEFIVPPSIDPISEKNRELTSREIDETLEKYGIPSDRPMILQVSRFDRFKDPIGVIKAYRLVKKYNDCILVLAGSPATDDPEGESVLNEVREFTCSDPDIFLLLLPTYSDKEINALQRSATVVLQKSLKEGFGLTVSEAMWKGKPVIGGAVGGIPLQIVNGVTGFLVHSIEGTAFRIRQFLNNTDMMERMGKSGKEHVRQNFLITRQIRDYLLIWLCMESGNLDFIEV
ncbi:trehalose synthase [bacterium BMS3Bbin06]|nr:trehalose synthase [bacterium BMS3Abin08]GBE34245.1 trehalose synthase [bacterium BMS3Bbin06]HDO35950.1 glycosyltransferase [Nitrospirota bacterium]HDY71348.1 glycosyltransferase [Nitrospirota bacterium]